MTLLYNHSAALARWAGDRLGIADWGPCVAIGVLRNRDIAAVVVYHQYRHPAIEVSIASSSKRWATPLVIDRILRYPFVQLECTRLTAVTKAKNQPVRAFLCRLGFHQEGVHPRFYEDDDAVSFGMFREDADRWLVKEEECPSVRLAA